MMLAEALSRLNALRNNGVETEAIEEIFIYFEMVARSWIDRGLYVEAWTDRLNAMS